MDGLVGAYAGDSARRLLRALHQQVHDLLAAGYQPQAVRMGWRQYGELRRWLSGEDFDAPRPREVLGLPVLPVGVPDQVEVLVSGAAVALA